MSVGSSAQAGRGVAHARLRLLFFTILFFMVASPALSALLPTIPLPQITAQLVLIATLSWLRDRPLLLWTGAILAVTTLVTSWTPGSPWMPIVASSSEAAFLAIALCALWSAVVSEEYVTSDALYGAVSMLVLIALFFAAVYNFIEVVTPGAFTFVDHRDTTSTWAQLRYFSFVTLTTLGYGDIAPVAQTARSIVSIEAVAGVLYPSIVIARLVSLYATGGRLHGASSRTAPAEAGAEERQERKYSVLLLMMLAQTLLVPWLQHAAVAPTVLTATKAAVLAAGIHVVSRRRSTVLLAALLALPAIVAAAAPIHELPPTWGAIGFSGELAFLALLIAVMSADVFRRSNVDRDTILGAICIYGLMISLWSSAYTFVEWLAPGSFLLPELASSVGVRVHLSYFSAMTLTTTGFGDISPITRTADALVVLESLAGIVFPATLVSLLVARYAAGADAEGRAT
jgi:hypothetical protein